VDLVSNEIKRIARRNKSASTTPSQPFFDAGAECPARRDHKQ
jgi:hypothetical protein